MSNGCLNFLYVCFGLALTITLSLNAAFLHHTWLSLRHVANVTTTSTTTAAWVEYTETRWLTAIQTVYVPAATEAVTTTTEKYVALETETSMEEQTKFQTVYLPTPKVDGEVREVVLVTATVFGDAMPTET